MGTLTTRQVYRLIGAPSRSVLWGLFARYEEIRPLLLHVQRGRGGSLWKAEGVPLIKRIYESQRSKFPYRQDKASAESRIKNLPKLNPAQRAKLEEKIRETESRWLQETDAQKRAALEGDLRYLKRVRRSDDRKKGSA